MQHQPAFSSISSPSLDSCVLHLGPDVEIKLSLSLPPSALEPLFSGGAWAGTHVWQASLYLCDFLARQPELVKGKTVLELGAGVGAPGLTSAVLGACRVLLTEQAPLDELLMKNASSRPDLFSSVSVEHIDWTLQATGSKRSDVDVVLISDCIYEGLYGESWRDLANVLTQVCRKDTRVFNCVERRNGDGVERFLKYCSQTLGMNWTLLESKALEDGEEIELYCI